MNSQCERIKNYIIEHGSITHLQAVNDLGICGFTARISDLRKRGELIVDEFIKVKNRYGETCEVKKYKIEVQNGRKTNV